MHVTRETAHRIEAISGVRAGLLDCVQSNLAVLADHFHGAGVHLRLGSKLSSRWYPGADDLPTFDPPLEEELAEAERVLALTARARTTTTGTRLARETWTPGEQRYAVADAHEMTWLPYFRRAHMDHSFLLMAPEAPDAPWTVVDAYDNETRWGAAKPGTWAVAPDDVALLGRIDLYDVEPMPVPGTRPALRVEHEPVDDYIGALARHGDRERALHRLTGDTWLLARSRRLHALFRAGGADPGEQTSRHLEQWDRFATQTYVAYRRVARGRSEPAGTLDRLAELLEADRQVFPPPAGSAEGAKPPGELRGRIAAVVGRVLGADPAALLTPDVDLAALPGYTSFRVIDIIDRLEAELAVELDSDDLVPENLRSMDGLCRIVHRATRSH